MDPMTGPEHYAEAQRLVDACPQTTNEDDWDRARADNLAAAQVHAILALVAAAVTPRMSLDRWPE